MPRNALGGTARKVALNMKTTPDVRERLEAAALASGRTLTHEVEHRIQSSLDYEYLLKATFGGDFQAEMFRRLAYVVSECRRACNEFGFDEIKTRQVVQAASFRVVSMYCWHENDLPQHPYVRVHGKSVARRDLPPEKIGIEIADDHMIWNDDVALNNLGESLRNTWSGDGKSELLRKKLDFLGNEAEKAGLDKMPQ